MRPVNLIPLEDRRGQNAPLRTGPVAYILIGALVLALAGVTALVLTGNQISDRESELAQVEREDAAATARAESLAPYAQFAALHEQRVATISSLADSRFDWERVMRELSLILPHDVWLVSLDATASAEAEGSSGGSGGSMRGSIAGPALAISGCAAGQEAVAGLVTALKDIDGVTRVGVESSELADQEEGAGSASESESDSGGGASSDCRTRSFIAQFDLVVAFDAAPVPVTGTTEEGAPVTATETSEASAEEVSGESSEEGSEGG
ncbi:MAG TPA: PilN domain-containing protein [Solirubrobacterales bacterium]|jgi:Tfp pilus assembly protein PilN